MNNLMIYPLAGRIAENDPHGIIITVVSVLVVFISLFILFLAYVLIGKVVKKCEKEQSTPRTKSQAKKIHRNEPHLITIRRKDQSRQLSISKKTADMTRGLLDIYGSEYDSDTLPQSAASQVPELKEDNELSGAASARTMTSPLPGVIVSINVNVGDKVSIGQEVAVLEAMKMENSIESEFEGTVTAIHISQGESVLEGGDIITIG